MFESNLKNYPLLFRGKVRDVYDLGDHLLLVTSDRVSAFDVILPTVIPGKGKVLTQVTEFWMKKFSDLIPNQLTNIPLSDLNLSVQEQAELDGRSLIVKKAKPLPVECVVRGYLLGSGYKDYQSTGQICGNELPQNLKLAQKLASPIFTPATKAEQGNHDENIDFQKVVDLVGKDVATKIREWSLQIYSRVSEFVEGKGLILADTKLEFGILDGQVILIDEVCTPDSSRYWSQSDYQVGISPPSYDKQIVRDYLETLDWNKTAPGPDLPQDVVENVAKKYKEFLNLIQ